MLGKIKSYIEQNQLFNHNDRILIGVSGGRDSVVLLHVLISLGHHVTAAHCNFNLRGLESDQETLFVKKMCNQLGVPCYVKHFPTLQVKKEFGSSTQLIARDLRYSWFSEIIKQEGLSRIVTAHHLDDQIETFLINLTRGTGLKGLLGIPVKRGVIVRPMLTVTRNEVTQYAQENKLAYKDDSSNEHEVYLRNKMRIQVLPQLKAANPSFSSSFLTTTKHLNQVHLFWEKSYQAWCKEFIATANQQGELSVDIGHIKEQSHEGFISQYLHSLGFSQGHIEQVLNSVVKPQNGATFYALKHQLTFNRGYWLLNQTRMVSEKNRILLPKGSSELVNDCFPIKLKVRRKSYDKKQTIPSSSNTVWIDKKRIQGDLFIKRWEQGDFFYPLGMSQKKKLSDFFIDRKISVRDKERIWLLCDEKSIIWIIGERIDNRYKVTTSTNEIVEFKVG